MNDNFTPQFAWKSKSGQARGHSIERENYIKDLNKANWNDNLRLLQQNGGEDEILVGGKIEEPSPFCWFENLFLKTHIK